MGVLSSGHADGLPIHGKLLMGDLTIRVVMYITGRVE